MNLLHFLSGHTTKNTAFSLLSMFVTEQGKLIIRIAFQLQIIKKLPAITKRSKRTPPATLQALELCVQIPHVCMRAVCPRVVLCTYWTSGTSIFPQVSSKSSKRVIVF